MFSLRAALSHCERHYQQEVHFFPAELSEQRDPACVRQVVNFASWGKKFCSCQVDAKLFLYQCEFAS